jgi:hypothetical protein
MPLMNEAVSKDNFDRFEKGLPPLKPKKVVIPDPPRPIVDNEVKMTDIPEDYEIKLDYAHRKTVRNDEGVMFIGFEVNIDLLPISKKRGPGRPKESDDPKPLNLKGWMIEGEFLQFVRTYRKQIDQQVINW